MDQIQSPKRMEIYMTNLPHIGGSIQYGYRPVLVIQNDIGNTNSSLQDEKTVHVKIFDLSRIFTCTGRNFMIKIFAEKVPFSALQDLNLGLFVHLIFLPSFGVALNPEISEWF